MKRQFNPRILLIVLAVLVLLGGGGYFLRAWQVKRNADNFLHEAEKYEQEKDYPKAVEKYSNYVNLRPDNADAFCHYAMAAAQLPDSDTHSKEKTLVLLDEALRRQPGRDDIRLAALNMAMSIPRYTDARKLAQDLLKKSPHDADLLEKAAIAEDNLAGGAFAPEAAEALAHYSAAIDVDPARVQCYVRKANLVRRLPGAFEGQDADRIMRELTSRNSGDYRAFLARADYLREVANSDHLNEQDRRKRLVEASSDINTAAGLAPDELAVLIAVGNDAQENGKLDRAQEIWAKGLKLYPNEVRFRFGLVQQYIEANQDAAARELLVKLQENLPKDASQPTLWALTDMLINVGEAGLAGKDIERLRQLKADRGVLDYLEAHLLLKSNDPNRYTDAKNLLEHGKERLKANPELARRADHLLVQCLGPLGSPEQQEMVYHTILRNRPDDLEAMYGLARVEIVLGKVDLGLEHLSNAVLDRYPESRLVKVRVLINRNLRESVDNRGPQWARILSILKPENDASLKELRKTVDYHQVEIELLLARAISEQEAAVICARHLQFDQACQKLAAVESLFHEADGVVAAAKAEAPREARYRLMQASLIEIEDPMHHAQASAKALEVIESAIKELGEGAQRADLRLARVSHQLEKAAGVDAIKLLLDAEKGSETWPKAERLALIRGLANLHMRYGNAKDAGRLLAEIKAKEPGDLRVHLQLFDLAVQSGDFAAASKLRAEMRPIEGENSPQGLVADAYLLLQRYNYNDRRNPADLEGARAKVEEIAQLRPTWSRIYLLRGDIALAEGDMAKASEEYRQAVLAGEHSFAVVRTATELLLGQRRIQEAMQLAKVAQDQGNVELMLIRRTDDDNPLEKAQEVVNADPDNAMAYLWFAQIALATNNRDRAEKALRKANDLDPKAPETWAALLVFLATDTPAHKDEAAKDVERVGKAINDPARLPQALAPIYEALGDKDKAEEQFKLLYAKVDPMIANQNMALFYQRTGQADKAEKLLQQMIATPDDNIQKRKEQIRWARRTLAGQWALSGNYQRSTEAIALLKKNQVGDKIDKEDAHVWALINAMRPGERSESIKRLEAARKAHTLSTVETLFLVHLYETDRDDSKAKSILIDLAERDERDNPVVLATFIRFLLRTHKMNVKPFLPRQGDDLALANEYLATLKRKLPDGPETVELEARLLAEKETAADVARAVELLKTTAEKQFLRTGDPAYFNNAAAVMEDVEERDKPAKERKKPETEKLLRRYVDAVGAKRDPKTQDVPLTLVLYVGRQERLAEAIDMLEKVAKDCSPEGVASTGVAVLRANRTNPGQSARVLALIESFLKEKPRSAALLLSKADLRDAEKNYKEAIQIYEEVLQIEPTNRGAMNNLAYLLAMTDKPKYDEALMWINKAIERYGPDGNLLDTRGAILCKKGDFKHAIDDFTNAVHQSPDYGRCFHLALAQDRDGKKDLASANMKQARKYGFQPYAVHPLEEPDRDRMEKSVQ